MSDLLQAEVDPLAQEMMTLAGVAYGRPSDIATYLADPALATGGRWSLRWLAADLWLPTNYAFLAQDGTTSRYALAIRGTYPNPLNPAYWEDASQDNPFGAFVEWPYPSDTGAMVSRGTWAGFQGVLALSDEGGTSLEAALASLPEAAELLVTGHSLGGTLAPVLAQWAKSLRSWPKLQVLSFAGMTPGNAAFAELVSTDTERYFNDLDSVPFGWNAVLQTRDFYQPKPQGGDLYKDAIDYMAGELAPYGFASVGEPKKLKGTVAATDDIPFVSFLIENLKQHLPDTYLDLLGAPRLPFTIGFGSATVPKNHPSLAGAASPFALPNHHLS